MSSVAHVRIARARGEADQAKARLMNTVEEAKARLAPSKLTSDAVQSAKDKSIVLADDAVAKVKERPGLTAGIATAAALYIARRPLVSAVRGFFRGSEAETAFTDHEKTSRRTADEQETTNG